MNLKLWQNHLRKYPIQQQAREEYQSRYALIKTQLQKGDCVWLVS